LMVVLIDLLKIEMFPAQVLHTMSPKLF
jgi:hypothetical protein